MGAALVGGLLDGRWDADALSIAEIDGERRVALEQQFPKVRVVPSPARLRIEWLVGHSRARLSRSARARAIRDRRRDGEVARRSCSTSSAWIARPH